MTEFDAILDDKIVMIDFSVPLEGLDRAESSLNQSAAKIAQIGSNGPSDSVDLSSELVTLLQARNSFQTNVAVLQTENQLTKSSLNIVG